MATTMNSKMGAFRHHLREAIAVNRDRAPRYSEHSRGKSLSVSRALISAEVLLLPIARWYDHCAAPYHRAGVPLLEELFVPMSNAPAYAADFRTGPPISGATVRAIRTGVGRPLRDSGFNGAAEQIERYIAPLEEAGGNHLLRHLLESARRLALLAQVHIRESERRGLRSPSPWLASLLALHLRGLGLAAALDRRAYPLQQRGIGILANDLPPIPRPKLGGPL